MDLEAIQEELKRARLDAWLFYDHHHRDPIAYHILQVRATLTTRRWYYIIPAVGEPQKLVHRIEREALAGLPGIESLYSSWTEQRSKLHAMLAGKRKVAMQYSPLNSIPYIGLVDAGTVELVKSAGVEVVSSADLVQQFEARWTPEALALHLEAGRAVDQIVQEAFRYIREATERGRPLDECSLQREILRLFEANDLESEELPIVAVNAHSGNPHYQPPPSASSRIRAGDFVLLDVWAKRRVPGAVYYDTTWTGFVGTEVPRRHAEVFDVVRQARDTGIELIQTTLGFGRAIRGFEVDNAVRAVIARHGYGDLFVHRTGHSIGQSVHGNGANLDNFETHDVRPLIPGTCFSVEPGIYLKDFGVRSEVDVYVEERGARVTGSIQQEIVPILAAS
ncbi:MAG: M24 family metallopeptidase [Terriglobia bacterium]